MTQVQTPGTQHTRLVNASSLLLEPDASLALLRASASSFIEQ